MEVVIKMANHTCPECGNSTIINDATDTGRWLLCDECGHTEIQGPHAAPEAGSWHMNLLCVGGCIAEKGGDLCDGDCAKKKIKNLFRYLDSFEYENDETNVAQIKNALDRDT